MILQYTFECENTIIDRNTSNIYKARIRDEKYKILCLRNLYVKLRRVDMYFVALLLVTFVAPFIVAHDKATPTTPATPACPQKCWFVYNDRVDKDIMSCRAPGSTFYGIAKLAKHRLEWNIVPGNQWPSETIVPSDADDTWGAAYYLSSTDFDTYTTAFSTSNGQKFRDCVEVDIQVTVNNGAENIKCFTFQFIQTLQPPVNEKPMPEQRKPAKPALDDDTAAFSRAGLPQDYINKIKAYPSRPYP